jgi:hypothetical protein
LQWLKKVTHAVNTGTVDPASWPAMPGSRVVPGASKIATKSFALIDSEYEKALNKDTPPFFSLAKFDMVPGRRKEMTAISFYFNLYSSNATVTLFNSPSWHRSRGPQRIGNNSLANVTFSTELIGRLNSLLCQVYFPPASKKIDYVIPESGQSYYEWRTKSGWLIRAAVDGVFIRIEERNRL